MAEIKKPANGKGYQGKNFDPNFDHEKYREEKKTKQKENKLKTAPRALASTIPGPSSLHIIENPTPNKNEPMYREAIFAPKIFMRKNNMRQTFSLSVIRTTNLSDQVWNEMTLDKTQIDKQMLVEGLRYYHAAIMPPCFGSEPYI